MEAGTGSGSGSALNPALLIVAGCATFVATIVSAMSIYLHIKNYRKPGLQRMVIRIMIMVPLYAISSLISLFSLEAAFVIDALRDIYEAFVIYCFFQLLLGYLGGERSLLILVHGRPPKTPPIPMNIFQRELDVSDPYTYLFLKRGILQYVQVKPILAIASIILKAVGKFNEGDLRADSGYLYISIVYNISICLSLYCLAMFWLAINEDLKPFRPMPKFLCVKGILFFSFWQSLGISILVSLGAIKRLGPYLDKEHISLGLTDTLICLEMPLFAIAHMYAFSHRDYIDPRVSFVGRMPMFYALRDAFGYKDVLEDSKATLWGQGMDYREFEPSEGFMHQGLGRERRIKAGLRYSKGGKGKYWLPQATSPTGRVGRAFEAIAEDEVHAPSLEGEADDILHDDTSRPTAAGFELPFGNIDEGDEALFGASRQYLFGDYMYPCIDASSEAARMQMWDEEERILRDERSAWDSDFKGRRRLASGAGAGGYGAVSTSRRPRPSSRPDSFSSPGAGGSGGHGTSAPVERLIDVEADRIAEGAPGDVKLKWTKVTRAAPSSSRSTSASASPRQPPSRLGRPDPAPRTHSSYSTPTSRSSAASSPGLGTRALARPPGGGSPRPDAVDLVVEDGSAVEAELARERRHGEPAVRGSGLRKVFRHQPIPGDAHRRTEEIEEEGEERIRVGGEEDLDQVARTMAEVEMEEDAGEVFTEDMTIARAQTPPAYARVEALTNNDAI
ncbi:organic solute transporter Ostalpha-domain-containing protein [Amylostereum chailletii]|nr:organic solute transporter Ostalpha-domain-containing protein [Amylostereum chailletii]